MAVVVGRQRAGRQLPTAARSSVLYVRALTTYMALLFCLDRSLLGCER